MLHRRHAGLDGPLRAPWRLMRRFPRTATTLFLDPAAEPLAEVAEGERIVVETADSLCGIAKARAPAGMHIDAVIDQLGGACPLTGPLFVSGAARGAALEVTIHRLRAAPPAGEGWTGIFGGFGALNHERYSLARQEDPEIRVLPYADGRARFPCRHGHVEIELRPFLGTVGVAPRRERRMTFSQSPEYLGDVDIPALAEGATVVLPVNVDGALVAFGDAHGAQGDGEITGVALEIEAEVELSMRCREREEAGLLGLPQINTAELIGSVAGFEGVTLADCARAAYADLIKRLERFHGFRRSQAYELLSLVGRLQIGNMIDPFYSVLASVERRYL
jgi:amidase